nr:MAG TPA: Head decoration protein, Viral protein.95A [Caudoviricetes sp.]
MKYDYTNEPDHLIIGKKELVVAELVLQVGKTVKRGDIVDKDGAIITDTGKVFGIVTRAADATGAPTKTTVFTEGEFNIEKVNFGTATKEKVIELCGDKNIYLRTLGGKE